MGLQRIMFIAGEPSGDALGAELIKSLREQSPGVETFGAGGPKMVAAGMRSHLDLAAHAVVGIVEVLKNYSKFKGFFDQLIAIARESKPDAVVLIDYPGFNLRFAKRLRELTAADPQRPRIIYYVSPQIWAWHESRIHQIAKDIDLLLAIFPFEEDWYRARVPDFRVQFVGHPVIDRYAEVARPTKAADRKLTLLLPGSRVRELRKHLPVMLEAAERLQKETGTELRLIVPNDRLRLLALELMRAHSPALSEGMLQVGGLAESLAVANLAIASSGTVTMECAYFETPTVVLYKTSWSTYQLGRRFIKTKYLAMPNLLAEEEIYPEYIQHDATAENLFVAARDLLTNAERRAVIQSKLQRVIASLGPRGASSRVATAILQLL